MRISSRTGEPKPISANPAHSADRDISSLIVDTLAFGVGAMFYVKQSRARRAVSLGRDRLARPQPSIDIARCLAECVERCSARQHAAGGWAKDRIRIH